ncbi:prepilin-type N-terminal cleavage/methylation domain-containing protein [Noviherbaspirillum sedimenti]|nr:prepilin-type N-terminal cleavage/methylation domain-containing protein [Noviherbaspirillum sedimenti]
MSRFQTGFTLIEAVMVIAITGVIAAVVAVFIRAPVQGYLDSSRRAALTDIADTAVRRMSRDLHLALPNSVRNAAGSSCIEFLPTITGGRYRAEQDCSAGCSGDKLDFDAADTGFDVLSPMSSVPAVGDTVAIYNLGVPGADAYAGDNTAIISTPSAGHLAFSSKLFPFVSPGNRFQIIPAADSVVSYVCRDAGTDASGNGTGILYRYSNYATSATAAITCPVPPAATPILANRVSACNFVYASEVTSRAGLVSLQLSITENNETVRLYHEVHVNNVP